MKPMPPTAAYLTTALAGALLVLTGCATTGTQRATKTTNSMQEVEGDYRRASAQIDTVRASLDGVTRSGQTDTKTAYALYAADVKKMEDVGNQLNLHSDRMRSRGNDYFAEWESAYTNPEIRELSERRRIEVRDGYARIPEASVGVKGALKSYLTDIGEISLYLSNDLTPKGIDAIRPVAERAVRDGETVKEAIKPVLAAIDRVKADMAQGGTKQVSSADGERK